MRTKYLLLAVVAAGLASEGRASAQNPAAGPVPNAPPTAPPYDPPPGTSAQPGAVDALQTITGLPCPTPDAAPTPPPPPPFGGPLHERPKLLGDWGGRRGHLRENGVTIDVSSTNFYSGVASGGLEQTDKFRGRLDYLLNVDGEKAGLMKGSFLALHAETIYGDSINPFTGTLLPISIAQAVPQPTGSATALTGVKFTQFLSESFAVYGGKINTLDDSNQPFTGGGRGVDGFMNTAFVFNPVFARTVPYSTFGAGFAILKDLQPVFTFSVFDANDNPTSDGFDTFFDNGVVLVPALNVPTKFFGLPGHQGVSGTFSTRRFAIIDRSSFVNPLLFGVAPQTKSNSWSLAYNFDQAVYVDPADAKRSWGVFGNLGLADQNPSPFRWFANIGVGGSSPLACRKLDTFGVGYFYLGVNDAVKELAPRLLPIRDEHGVEVFYNAAVTPWCRVTPDLQVILPGRQRAESVLALGLRMKLDF